ncbi:MAG TPA: hypothetical protein PK264_01870 [Hyphomicrobiaceae bacterium]|nr:hypothetical protein [Hyphomicrobiaceae bacterium]
MLREMIDPFKSGLAGALAPKPLEVDFHRLPMKARPYLLGPFLKLNQGDRFPELDLEHSTATTLVMVHTGGPVDADLWRAHLPAINAWLNAGVFPFQWTITDHSASILVITRQSQLPPSIPFDRSAHLTAGALFAGIDVTQRMPVHIPFAELSSGTYITGAAGAGKTNAVHILLRSIFANIDLFAEVHLVDGKDGVAFMRYAGLHPKIRVLHDEPDVWALAQRLTVLMKERNIAQRRLGVDKATRDYIALVIDELPTYIAKPPKAQRAEHEAFLDNMLKIAMRGRSAGIRMMLITQSPVADQIPVTLRTNCSTRIVFRLPEQSHAVSLFGELTPTNDPRKLTTGQAIVDQSDTGRTTKVQFPFAPLFNPRGRP